MAGSVAVAAGTGVRLDIQGMRALALLMILVFHAGLPVPGGFAGVDVFFVISGFVITAMLVREHDRSGRIDLRRFYLRRFRRLTPALALTASVVAVLSIVLESPFGAQQITAATVAGAMLLVANVVIAATTGDYFSPAAESNPLLNVWSLSVEEQFYLVFPAVLILGWLLTRRRGWAPLRGPLVVVAVLTAASFAFAVVTSGPALDWPMTALFGYFGAVGRAWEFAAGALLALLGSRFAGMSRWAAEGLAWAGLVLILVSLVLLREDLPYPGWWTLVPVGGTLALIAAGGHQSTTVSRLLSVRPMTWVGDVSYSWYLWHWPMVVFALALWPSRPLLAPAVAVAASVVPAALSYRLVEQPIRRTADMTGRRLAVLALACFGIPLALAVLLAAGARGTWWMQWPTSYDYRDSASYARGCHDSAPGLRECRWATPGAERTVLLLGDSQALSLSDGLIAANDELGLATEVSSYSQCPFALPGRISFAYENDGCDEWQQAALDYALESNPDLVVIANRPYVNQMTGGTTLLDADGRVPQGSSASAQAWVDALGGVVGPLREAGIPVLIAAAVPEASYDMPPTGILHLGRARSTLEEAVRQRSVPFAADLEVAELNPGTSVYDPVPVLCDVSLCPDVQDGAFLYADPRHLSVAGSLTLVPSLRDAVADAISAG